MINLEQFLQDKFEYSSFKLGQKETIESLLKLQNTFSILPTGTGKSLCYQLSSYLLSGQTIIVSPLISLMEDQVNQLRQMGEKSVIAVNSNLDYSAKKYVLNHLNQFKFIFISPETLNQFDVLERIKGLNLALFVVDEAHCISEWGHDFRPSYLTLKRVIKELNYPLTLALTATATKDVKEDIKAELFSVNGVQEFCHSVDRPNIFYQVETCDNKVEYLEEYFKDKNVPSIIYFSSRKEAERVCERLRTTASVPVAVYHGNMDPSDRIRIQQQFIHDEIRILCATSAFGMGVNKDNVRVVIHYHLPNSLENYVQESGRAGRDNKQSLSIILYQVGDERIHHFLQEENFNQKKDLLFLKDKTKEQLKQFENSLTDTQMKWLSQLEQSGWDWETFEKNIKIRQFEKNKKIHSMKNYIMDNGCRRTFILDYFDNSQTIEKNESCCDFCQQETLEIPNLIEEISEEVSENHKFDAKKLLKKLFLNKF